MHNLYRKKGSGGAREGSGRPRVGKFTRSVFVTDKQWTVVKKFVAELKAKEVK